MIETKYGLKYPMPHSLVHIVDNSQYDGPLPVVVAEDPSLLATIVVTGAPMGADNKMITITRSDVLGVAYGMANLSVDDINKYGQGVTYAESLIRQGGPVRFMRITPEGSTYAASCLVVQWRLDGTDNKIHVRFKVKEWPEDLQRESFKNTIRVNEALVKKMRDDAADKDGGGVWKQRAFVNFISAGRGEAYNYMANAINLTTQAKRPPNVRYEFATIDTRTDQVIERFYASLMNINNGNRADAIDSVNTAVSKRLEGSSIVVPYVNEAAVRELYNEYMSHYKDMLENTDVDEFTSNAYKAMNINIFDMVFGNYIYNGTDTSTKMPFYQVDMIDTDVPELPEERRLDVINDEITIGSEGKSLWDPSDPEVLYSKLEKFTYGVSRNGDSVYVGDLYLTLSGNSNTNPKINVVTAINQYTGNVTSMTIPRVFPLNFTEIKTEDSVDGKQHEAWTALYKLNTGDKTSRIISVLVDDIDPTKENTKEAVSATVNKLAAQGSISTGSVIAAKKHTTDTKTGAIVETGGFDIYTAEVITNTNREVVAKLHPIDHSLFYEMLDRSSHSGGESGTGNAMGFYYTKEKAGDSEKHSDSAWNRLGATVVINSATDSDNGTVKPEIWVNGYQRLSTDPDTDGDTTHRIKVKSNTDIESSFKIGTVPTSVNLTEDLMGTQYDVKVYKNEFIDKWKITNLKIEDAGEGYVVGDRLWIDVLGNKTEAPVFTSAKDNAKTAWESTENKNASAEGSSDFESWYSNDSKKSLFSDTVNTDACRTIITVAKVDANGGILAFNITKNNSYDAKSGDDNTKKTVLDVFTEQKGNGSGSPKYFMGHRIPVVGDVNLDEDCAERLAGDEGCEGCGKSCKHPKKNATFSLAEFKVTQENSAPTDIRRFTITGALGSLYRVQINPLSIPANYYSDSYGINPTSEVGGIKLSGGSTGFFDDPTINEIEYKWRYSALLVRAFRGDIDPRIQSPTRVPAKFMFDAGYNTIVGSTILPYLTYTPTDIINASTIFTEDEKEDLLFNPDVIANVRYYEDIDVKQAMYDLMIYRCYQGIPEDKRPIGPGSGLSLHLDSGVTDANTMMLMNTSFAKRFDNPNASWDIGGWTDTETGISYTFTKQLVDNLINHMKRYGINKPYTGAYSAITADRYASYFPDVDTTDWELRELLYNSGGNAWIMEPNGNLTRRSQRTLLRDADTSDLLQESNMRTLSQLVYLLQNKIDSYLLEYNDDSVLKTLSDEVNNMFSNWVGNLVDGLEITFARDINIDGGEILVCYVNVVFRGLILRVPIIVNVNRRDA